MKILQVSSMIPNSLVLSGRKGGGEDFVSNLCTKLADQGHEVTLLLPKFYGNQTSLICHQNLKPLFIRSIRLPVASFEGNSLPLDFLKMKTTRKYDIVHVHNICTFLSLYAAMTSKFSAKTKLVVTDHGGGVHLLFPPKMMMRLFDASANVSNFSLNYLSGLSPSKKHFAVYCGVNLSVLGGDSVASLIKLKQRLNLEGYFVCLYIGRIMRHKGLEIAVRALKHLPDTIKIVFVGPFYDLEYLNYLRTLIVQTNVSERVLFTGDVSAQEKNNLLSICDVLVCPSVYKDVFGGLHPMSELFGIAKLEGMGSKKPVVVSDVGGLPEGIVDGYNGYIFRSGCSEELVEKLLLLYSDSVLQKRIGELGYKTVKEKFTWDHVANRVISCYTEIQKG